MAAPGPEAGRCPHCGTFVAAPPVPAGATSLLTCPVCGHAVVIVPVRDPPPLYTWEVYPNLYPSAPLPRGNPFRWRPAIVGLLWATAVLLAGTAGTLAVVSAATVAAGPVTVTGTVATAGPSGALVPLPGATVRLTADAGAVRTEVTDLAGRFSFRSVPDGGISLNVSYLGLGGATVALFASPFYSSPDLTSLVIPLGPMANGTVATTATDFSDLESYVTSVGTGAVLVAVGALAAVAGCFALDRTRPGPAVAATALGAALAPTTLYLLGLFGPFPSLLVPGTSAAVLGSAATILAAARRWALGPFDGDPGTAGPPR